MKREEITHLASLARIELTDQELDTFGTDLSQIVDYVSTVSDIAADEADTAPVVGARYNVLRPDEVTNDPDQFTESILREMPNTQGRSMAVKKILKTE
jgi:aspartyl-tRNA(Asn)/glutamyl-tRNA(Gln) amidotransferase subunit C